LLPGQSAPHNRFNGDPLEEKEKKFNFENEIHHLWKIKIKIKKQSCLTGGEINNPGTPETLVQLS